MFQAVSGYRMGTQPLPAPHVQITMHQYMDFHVVRERRVRSNLEWGLDPRENDMDSANNSLRVIPAYVDQNHQIEDFNRRFSLIPVQEGEQWLQRTATQRRSSRHSHEYHLLAAMDHIVFRTELSMEQI